MDETLKLLVKFKPDAISHVEEGNLYFHAQEEIRKYHDFVLDFDYCMALPELASTGEFVCQKNGIDFSPYKGLVYVKASLTDNQLEKLAAQYRQLDIVEYVFLESTQPIAPPDPNDDISGNTLTTTHDLTHHQTYHRRLSAAGVYGIDTDYAWSRGITGRGISIANIEWGHNFSHEDLVGNNFIELYRTTDSTFDDHGTAVASLTLARDNGFGMLGSGFDIDAFYGVSEIPFGRLAAISRALRELTAGDILSYQMQERGRPGGPHGHFFVPADFHPAVWDLTQLATSSGITVIMAAANGGEDLLNPFYSEYIHRGDNGGIRVGAGSQLDRHRLTLSNFGLGMVHVQGWGEGVAAAGYGDLFDGGINRRYTNQFSGTSSATALVTASAVSIQSWCKATFGLTLTSTAMRDIMIRTGMPQGAGAHIGPLPSIRRAIGLLTAQPPFPLWQKERNYTVGDRVFWNGGCWELQWWSRGIEPGVAQPSGGVIWQSIH